MTEENNNVLNTFNVNQILMENANEVINGFDEIDPDRNHFNNDNDNDNCKTYSIDSFNSNVNINCQSLNIYHNNSQSILKPGKQDEYNMLFRSLQIEFDLLIFTETWIVEDKMNLCQFSDYTPVHLIRPISNDINFKDKGVVYLFLSEIIYLLNIEKIFP